MNGYPKRKQSNHPMAKTKPVPDAMPLRQQDVPKAPETMEVELKQHYRMPDGTLYYPGRVVMPLAHARYLGKAPKEPENSTAPKDPEIHEVPEATEVEEPQEAEETRDEG